MKNEWNVFQEGGRMAFEDQLKHNCIIYQKKNNQLVFFDNGSHVFSVGEVVTCGVADASGNLVSIDGHGTIVSVTTDASGNMQLSNVSGAFVNNHTLKGSLGGLALVNGSNSDYRDENGQFVTYEVSSVYKCRIYRPKIIRNSGITTVSEIDVFVFPISVMLPNTLVLTNDAGEIDPRTYRLSTTVPGYAGVYSFQDVKPLYGSSGIHHYEASIVRVA